MKTLSFGIKLYLSNKTLYIDKNKKTGTLYNGSYSNYEKIKKEKGDK